jgi:membrane protease YdiL (CAAX protease family)
MQNKAVVSYSIAALLGTGIFEYLWLVHDVSLYFRIWGFQVVPSFLLPGMLAIIWMLWVEPEKMSVVGFRPGRFAYWFVALCYPLLLIGGIVGIGVLFKLLKVVEVKNVETVILGAAFDFPVNFIWTLGLTLGSEFGWRGYLFRKLSAQGFSKAAITSSLIGTASHAVAIFLIARQSSNWLLALWMFLFVTSSGVIFAWIYARSKSLWTASFLLHGLIVWGILIWGGQFSLVNRIYMGTKFIDYEGIFRIKLLSEQGEWFIAATISILIAGLIIIRMRNREF